VLRAARRARNVVKLISLAYGQVLNQLKPSGRTPRSARRATAPISRRLVHAVDADERGLAWARAG